MTPRGVAHGLIRAYQLSLSGLVGRQCRYLPSCSDYADEAIQRHGVLAGSWMGAARICRCHPWGGSGYDPVPHGVPDRPRWLFQGRRPGPLRPSQADERQERATSAADNA